ncbi:MAG: arylamine N-acetyltransferase [Pseudomonadales bacterium]|nr:arylamine N-acetyltransferase [Pseudomonadales bacterium]
MSFTPAQLAQYCRRIAYNGPLAPTRDTLHALHRLHPLAIAFENLDPWLGQPPALDPEALFDKLVTRERGGYCFEQNGLFKIVLQSLGFAVRGLSARVLWDQHPNPPRTHQLSLVEIQGQEWLADVGFGLTPLAPLRFAPEMEQRTPLETFRLRQQGGGFTLEVLLPGGAKPMYWFTPETSAPADYIQSNWYVSTYPESRFVRNLIASRVRAEPGGGYSRHNLFNRDYSVYRLGQAPELRQLQNAGELRHLLREIFTLPLDALPGFEARAEGLFGG